MRRTLICLSVFWIACGQESTAPSPAEVTGAVVVAHTTTGIVTASTADWENNPFRERVDELFPSICLDFDHDDDGVPDSVDIDRDDDGPDAVEHQCHRCNRGPGESVDFRLEASGGESRLDRGIVIARAADGTLTVPSPDGPITIHVTATTRIDDGTPTPGSEIRAEGPVEATRVFTATEVKVLC